MIDFTGRTVLVTGGTRGIGLATALSFARYGAACVLTYNWGDHDEDVIKQQFAALNAPVPILLQADVANKADTENLMKALKTLTRQIDVFISNVSVSAIIRSFEDYTLKGLKQSISYSSWPVVSYTKAIQATFGQYPKHIVAVSSTGPDHYSAGYDFVAASKAVMETLVRYMNVRLRPYDVCINAVRSRAIRTQSFENTFGKNIYEFAASLVPDSYWIEPEDLAAVIAALCSGYCNAISGQVINVDKGTTFFDNLMEIYTRTQKQKAKADE